MSFESTKIFSIRFIKNSSSVIAAMAITAQIMEIRTNTLPVVPQSKERIEKLLLGLLATSGVMMPCCQWSMVCFKKAPVFI